MTGGRIYMKINIGYPITADRVTFQRDFKQYCDDADIKFYRATVQHHNVKTICWLAYLTNYTNCELLSQVMTRAFRASTGKTVEIGLSWRKLNSHKDVAKNDQVSAVHVTCPYEHTAIVKRFLRSCSHQKIYPGGTKFRVINEYWPYMTQSNKKKYRYMKDKHKYFLDNIDLCSTSQPIDIDTRIPGTKSTIRTILLAIRDKQDNHRVFNSIDVRWNSDSIYNITYRPDKKSLAYMYCNSLSTYVHHLHPEADLSKIFSLDAIDQAGEETYVEDSQTFITQEDLAMQMEIKNDADDDSLEWHDFSQIRPLDDDLSEVTPDVEIRNPRLFNLSGETESVSTIGNSVSSTVTFRENEDDIYDTQSLATQTSTKTNDSKSSQKNWIDTIESSTIQTSNEVAALRTEMTNFMKLLQNNIPNLPVAPTEAEQATGPPKFRHSQLVTENVRKRYETMKIEDYFDNDMIESKQVLQQSPPISISSSVHNNAYQNRIRTNTSRPRRAQSSLFDYLPQSFQNRYGNDNDKQNMDWGSSYKEKAEKTIRVWYTNPNGLGVNPTGPKSHSTFSFLFHKSKADIVCLAETNLNWPILQYNSRLNSRIRAFYREFYSSASNNRHEKHNKSQRGGTCTFVVNQTTYRVHRSGSDPTGMGRWSWIQIDGKDNHRTRVLTAYRPCKPPSNSSLTTTWDQQERYIRTQGWNLDPRAQFDFDLRNLLQT